MPHDQCILTPQWPSLLPCGKTSYLNIVFVKTSSLHVIFFFKANFAECTLTLGKFAFETNSI
jgi:hypothetical protein